MVNCICSLPSALNLLMPFEASMAEVPGRVFPDLTSRRQGLLSLFWVSLQDAAHSPLCTARAKRYIWWVQMPVLQILLNNFPPPCVGKPTLLPSFTINQCHTKSGF